jgi:hypothetical protein
VTAPERQPRLAHVPMGPTGAELLRQAFWTMNQAATVAFEYENPDIGTMVAEALKDLAELARYLGVELRTSPGPASG